MVKPINADVGNGEGVTVTVGAGLGVEVCGDPACEWAKGRYSGHEVVTAGLAPAACPTSEA